MASLNPFDGTRVSPNTDAIERSLASRDAPLDIARHVEANIPSDRPGLIMRRRLLELVHAQGHRLHVTPCLSCSRRAFGTWALIVFTPGG